MLTHGVHSLPEHCPPLFLLLVCGRPPVLSHRQLQAGSVARLLDEVKPRAHRQLTEPLQGQRVKVTFKAKVTHQGDGGGAAYFVKGVVAMESGRVF